MMVALSGTISGKGHVLLPARVMGTPDFKANLGVPFARTNEVLRSGESGGPSETSASHLSAMAPCTQTVIPVDAGTDSLGF